MEHPPVPRSAESLSTPDPGSFRDPGSRVFHLDDEVYRALSSRALEHWAQLSKTEFFNKGMAEGRIIGTEMASDVAPPPGDWAGVLRHERIPFVSYPYEWTFSMLRDAALLHLDLMEAALGEDMILKDSTPYNIQFRGRRPVFIDIGSCEILEPGDLWIGYRQFLQMFLYPLMMRAYKDLPFQPWLRGSPDGINAEEIRNMLSGQKFKKGVMLHVSLQARAEQKHQDSDRDVRTELKEAGFKKELIENNVRGLRKVVSGLEWDSDQSVWSDYAAECDHVGDHRDLKAQFLREELAAHPSASVWDIGANDGHFSRIAADSARYAVAMDSDELVLDHLYRTLGDDEQVLPLLQDAAMPSPGLGWGGKERMRLEDRATPDLVLCFAVIHHLVIGRNIPLGRVVDWLSGLGSRVILEFVLPEDPMVKRLTANKRPHEVHPDYTEEALRAYLEPRFVIERESLLPGEQRRLFALRPSDTG
jgi:hypothetical protein